jgi:multidrug efflux pump subunit AcrB
MADPRERADRPGPIAWMARNPVAANLLMFMLLIGGAILGWSIKREVYPEVDLDRISVSTAYPGAAPGAVEEGVTRPIEEAVRGLDTIKTVQSWTGEGYSWMMAEVLEGQDSREVLDEVEAAVERSTLPAGIERPRLQVMRNRQEVISLMIHGDVPERALYGVADWARDGLLGQPGITVVEVSARRASVVHVDLDRVTASRYGLTPQLVAQTLGAASVELPAGQLDTQRGRVLMRVSSRGETAAALRRVPLLVSESGGTVTLGEVAEVRDEYADTAREAYYQGERAVRLDVYRVGEQRPIAISREVRAWAEEHAGSLPPGISMSVWDDESEEFRARIDLLVRNAGAGLLLVLLVLGLFLEARLAFWVTLGIPISFLGAMWALAATGVSINMISLFAFIIALGIVVDDAIVVGEAAHTERAKGLDGVRAATSGAREVASPVVFSVLTTVVAFVPLLFVPGVLGKFFRVVPLAVIPILLLSLVESLLVLPAHLSHMKPPKGRLARAQQAFSRWFEGAVERFYTPVVRFALRQRYAAFALGIGFAALTWGAFEAGALKFTFFPKIEGDVARSGVQFPIGTAREETEAAMKRVVAAAREELDARGGAGEVSVGTYSELGRGFQVKGGGDDTGDHLARVSVQLAPADARDFSTTEFTRAWRERVGTIPGVDYLAFDFNSGPSAGAGYEVALRASDPKLLSQAAEALGDRLARIEGVYNVDAGGGAGSEQLVFELNAEGRRLGLTQVELARQLDASFRGAEAFRMMRGREEVRVYVRRPTAERGTEASVEDAVVRLPSGLEVPLSVVASLTRARTPRQIVRTDGERIMSVNADIDTEVAPERAVRRTIEEEVLPKLRADFPGVRTGAGKRVMDQQATLNAIARGALLALLGIYALMAVAFRSYVQPLIVMIAIPFGVVGAFAGHMLMEYDLSMVSLLGIVALSGVVVNDALVLIVAVNERREQGDSVADALVAGGVRRFRPILLTSLTTFGGLAPMIWETSRQAKFLIPMAISLGFGVLFVTFIALVLVPAIYHIIEDARGAVAWMLGR